MVPPDSTGISRAPAYSGTLPLIYSRFVYGTLTLSGPPFQARSTTLLTRFRRAPQPRSGLTPTGLGSSPFARRYLGNLIWFLFLQVLRCFSSLGSPQVPMYSVLDNCLKTAGFSHSEIPGSKLITSSPRLIADFHVLHRLLPPRHPPCALIRLVI